MRRKAIVLESIAWLFMLLFLYTAVSKLMDYTVFKEELAMSPILSPVASLAAGVVPAAEIVASILLLIPKWRVKGFYAAFILMLLFTAYVLAILCIDEKLPCSCGGIIGLLSWKQHLVLNSVLALVAGWGIWMANSRWMYRKKQTL
jgi:uncharacterized membrane protein YphA (DoxX/SURF4 family)